MVWHLYCKPKEAVSVKNQMTFQRYEYKYLLTKKQQETILRGIEPYMRPDAFPHSSIRNIYYDTPDDRLIRTSLSQPIYKEKLRIRSYGKAGAESQVFVELKKKYDGIVYKRRLTMPRDEAFRALAGECPLPDSQIGREIGAFLQHYPNLQPKAALRYERDSFAETDGDFRLTFDQEIRYSYDCLSLNGWGERLLPEDWVLMELKLPTAMPIWMARLLSDQEIYKTRFSKYGTAYENRLRMGMGNVRDVI